MATQITHRQTTSLNYHILIHHVVSLYFILLIEQVRNIMDILKCRSCMYPFQETRITKHNHDQLLGMSRILSLRSVLVRER